MPSAEEIEIEDIIEEEDVVITLTHFGYIKEPLSIPIKLKKGRKGIIALTTREEDFVEDLYITSTHDTILFFTNKGRVYSLKAYEIPEGSRQARGTAIVNLLNISGDEKVNSIIPINKNTKVENLIIITKNGTIKKTKLEEFENIRKNGLI